MSKLSTSGLILAAAAMLLLPALWNGYPFIFFDSGDYLVAALSGERVVYRDPVYGFLVAPLHGRISLWGVAVGQSLLAAWILHECVRQVLPAPGRAKAYLGIVALLAAGSSLPWFSGQVMPDILGALAVLLFFLVALGDMPDGRRLVFAALLAVAIACHLSFLPLGLALLLLLALLKRGLARRGVTLRLAGAGAAMAAAPAIIVAANLALGGPAKLSQTGHAFLLARLVQDGLAKRTLDRLCPDAKLKLCAHKDALPATANDFLWGDSAAFAALGGWLGSKEEADRVIAASLRLFPLEHAASAAKLSLLQLVSFSTGDGLESQAEPWVVIEAQFPADFPLYVGARQQTGRLPLAFINRHHMPLAALAVCLTPLLGWAAWRQKRYRESAGLMLITCALLANAAICGALSNPNDRYQSRMVWLAVFALALAAADFAQRRRIDRVPPKV
jgi:hypothetical protein